MSDCRGFESMEDKMKPHAQRALDEIDICAIHPVGGNESLNMLGFKGIDLISPTSHNKAVQLP